MSMFETIDKQLVTAILEFVISSENFGSVVYLKKVCKMFHLVISSPMFGRFVSLWSPVEYQQIPNLQYTTLQDLRTELSQLQKLEQSTIRNVYTFVLDVFIEESERPDVRLDFMKYVKDLTVNFCDDDNKQNYQRYDEATICLPESVKILCIFSHFNNDTTRIPIGSIKGGLGVENVELWTDDQVYGTVTMWRDFFILHKQTLKTLTFNLGVDLIERNFPLVAFSSCHVKQLNLTLPHAETIWEYEVNISLFVQLKIVDVTYCRGSEVTLGDKPRVMIIVHITMTHEQSKTITIHSPKLSLIKKIVIE